MFSTTIIALTEGKVPGRETKLSEADRAKWLSDVTECLRTYDALGQWRDAEEVLRRDVVREFVKKVSPLPPSRLAYDLNIYITLSL